MKRLAPFFRDDRGNAAAEMALVMPFLLVLLTGSVELGNYFMDEHMLVKGVRDGARYAARQDFSNYTACSGSPGGTVVADTKNIVRTGQLSGGTDRLPNWGSATFSVTTSCATTAGGQNMKGIYVARTNGAQIVTVSARVPYAPVLEAFGFRGTGFNLNATAQAAVTGI